MVSARSSTNLVDVFANVLLQTLWMRLPTYFYKPLGRVCQVCDACAARDLTRVRNFSIYIYCGVQISLHQVNTWYLDPRNVLRPWIPDRITLQVFFVGAIERSENIALG